MKVKILLLLALILAVGCTVDFNTEENNTQKIEQTSGERWEVRWDSRDGAYHSDVESQVDIFFTKKEAKAFTEELKAAQKVLRNTDNIHIRIEKSKN